MKFIHEGVQYRIRFQRHDRSTLAYVDDGDHVVASGATIRHPQDQHCMETGRKKALKNALKTSHRDFRRAVWTAYHTRSGGLLASPFGEDLTDREFVEKATAILQDIIVRHGGVGA